MERLRAIVIGRVQGVGYRQYARMQARFLGLVGTVRNDPSGNVEVVAEGPRAALNELLGALRQGPSYADVENVVPVFTPATGEFRGFEIVR